MDHVLDFLEPEASSSTRLTIALYSTSFFHYGKINTWIVNFLKDKQEAVIVDGNSLSFVPEESSVSYGGILGPVLFLLYLNDLPQQTDSTTRLFTDDTICQRSISTAEDQATLQNYLDNLAVWEDRWNMCFHPGKCKVLSRGKKKFNHQYTLHGQILTAVISVLSTSASH